MKDERTVDLLTYELHLARLALKAIRDAHADVQFDTPEDTALQTKAIALADSILDRFPTRPNPITNQEQDPR